MPHSNNQPQVLNSELQNLIQTAQVHISNDASGVIKKLVPEKHHNLLHTTKPLFKLANMPTPDVMLTNVFDSMANLPTEFWLDLENMILGVIAGDPDSKARLLQLIGALQHEHHDQA